MKQKIKITVVGTGFVGISIAVLLAKDNKVIALDIDQDKVNKVNNQLSTVEDKDIDQYFNDHNLDLKATLDQDIAYSESDLIIIATPTDFDIEKEYFDTRSVDNSISEALKRNNKALIVIKSTVPIGYTRRQKEIFNTDNIVFSPEFLREGRGLRDNLYPSRIVIGSKLSAAKQFVELMKKGAIKKDIDTFFLPSDEAEAVKLFANNYLAMRVAFFNELDSFAQSSNLDTRSIIEAVTSDARIGKQYSNPSFGYGGYCLPKDTKQLEVNFKGTPQKIISAIIDSNAQRKDFLTNMILGSNAETIGIYRLIMKSGSDNFRSSAIFGIMKRLQEQGKEIVIYEPLSNNKKIDGSRVISNLSDFKEMSDIIVANRMSEELSDVFTKVFTRDIFGNN